MIRFNGIRANGKLYLTGISKHLKRPQSIPARFTVEIDIDSFEERKKSFNQNIKPLKKY